MASPKAMPSSLVWYSNSRRIQQHQCLHMCMQAYRLACHYGDTEEEVHETMKISSSAVFNKLMLFVLKEADHIFLRMLSLDEQTSVTARDVQKSKRLKKVESLLKSFLGNSLHLLGMNNTLCKASAVSLQEKKGEYTSLHVVEFGVWLRHCRSKNKKQPTWKQVTFCLLPDWLFLFLLLQA